MTTSEMTYRGTTAMITGASSGIGAEFAARFAERGADVVLVARREDRLRALAAELEERHNITATVLPLDLGVAGIAATLRRELDDRGIRVDTLIGNAGFGARGAILAEDPDRLAAMIQLNVVALTAITREFLPDLVASGRGALVNVASVVAYQPTPYMAVYGATKAFVLSLTEAIAYETRDTGLRVLALSPGSTATEFFEIAGAEEVARGMQTPAQVVETALKALDRRSTPPSVVSGATNAVASMLSGIIPRRVVLEASGRLLA
ncbi:SDR family NAD(P)-dependent oxidoreductase [Microbacterium sp. NPDC078428]|uniref:SDR family NAD(P)-dependent oxidoreductase n=1 Tax=Microbacterium sp. NPDC078428 TaxID=3364190 RepID=UPI0037CA069A